MQSYICAVQDSRLADDTRGSAQAEELQQVRGLLGEVAELASRQGAAALVAAERYAHAHDTSSCSGDPTATTCAHRGHQLPKQQSCFRVLTARSAACWTNS